MLRDTTGSGHLCLHEAVFELSAVGRRCEVKVIDLGSSCFISDHLSSYVQSRSYRAPEVILGLPYDQKIDIWSFGCILAELLTGSVLFQVTSKATKDKGNAHADAQPKF